MLSKHYRCFLGKKSLILHLALTFPSLHCDSCHFPQSLSRVECTWTALCGGGVDIEGAESMGDVPRSPRQRRGELGGAYPE